MRKRVPSGRGVVAWVLVAACAVAACGGASRGDVAADPSATALPTATAQPAQGEPVLPVRLVDGTGATVTVSSVERIIPVDGDLAEIVFALGLGDRVVATDLSATYPAAADALPEIGYQRALTPEPIAAMEPTVVLATDLARPVETLEQLRDLGIAVVVIERVMSLDGFAAKVQAVADALGVPARGAALVAQMQADIARARVAAAQLTTAPRVLALYLRGDQTQLIFGADTGIDAVLPAVGAVDVAAELGVVDTQQLTAEAVLLAAPDVLLVTTSGLASVGGVEGLLAIPGLGQTADGRRPHVLAYEDQYLLGGGPRVGLLLELIDDLAALPTATAIASEPTASEPTPDESIPTTEGTP